MLLRQDVAEAFESAVLRKRCGHAPRSVRHQRLTLPSLPRPGVWIEPVPLETVLIRLPSTSTSPRKGAPSPSMIITSRKIVPDVFSPVERHCLWRSYDRHLAAVTRVALLCVETKRASICSFEGARNDGDRDAETRRPAPTQLTNGPGPHCPRRRRGRGSRCWAPRR